MDSPSSAVPDLAISNLAQLQTFLYCASHIPLKFQTDMGGYWGEGRTGMGGRECPKLCTDNGFGCKLKTCLNSIFKSSPLSVFFSFQEQATPFICNSKHSKQASQNMNGMEKLACTKFNFHTLLRTAFPQGESAESCKGDRTERSPGWGHRKSEWGHPFFNSFPPAFFFCLFSKQ